MSCDGVKCGIVGLSSTSGVKRYLICGGGVNGYGSVGSEVKGHVTGSSGVSLNSAHQAECNNIHIEGWGHRK